MLCMWNAVYFALYYLSDTEAKSQRIHVEEIQRCLILQLYAVLKGMWFTKTPPIPVDWMVSFCYLSLCDMSENKFKLNPPPSQTIDMKRSGLLGTKTRIQ